MSGANKSERKDRKDRRGKPPTALQVGVRRIPPEGMTVVVPLAELAASAYQDTEADAAASSLNATLTLHPVGDDAVVVTGELQGTLVIVCDRCAEPSSVNVRTPINATFVPERELKDEDDELELQAGDLDTYPYNGDEVDLEECLREQLVVAIPMTHLCQPGCKGLCTQCGKNWNEGPCDCAAVVLEKPRALAEALKAIKLT